MSLLSRGAIPELEAADVTGLALRPARRGRWLGLFDFTVRIAMVGTIVIAAPLLGLTVAERFSGYSAYTIVSGSMAPTIPVGSLVIDRTVDASTIRTGDIITFHPPRDGQDFITHRVVGFETLSSDSGGQVRMLVTKGDANGVADPWRIPAEGRAARYQFHVAWIGGLAGALQTRVARLTMIALPMTLYVLIKLVEIWSTPTPGDEESRGAAESRSV